MSDSLEKIKPFLTVNLLGEERPFRFSLWSCAQYQKLTKKSLLSGGVDVFNVEELASLLWAGLIPDNKQLDGKIDAEGNADQKIQDTINEILQSLDLSDFKSLVEIIEKAIKLSQPKESDAPKKKEKEKA